MSAPPPAPGTPPALGFLTARLGAIAGRVGCDPIALSEHLVTYAHEHLASTLVMVPATLSSLSVLTPVSDGWRPEVVSALAPEAELLERATRAARAPSAFIGRRFVPGRDEPLVFADASWQTAELDRVLAALEVERATRDALEGLLANLPPGRGDSVRVAGRGAQHVSVRRHLRVRGEAETRALGEAVAELMQAFGCFPLHVAFVEDAFLTLRPPGPEHDLSVGLRVESGRLVRALELELIGLPGPFVVDLLVDFGGGAAVGGVVGMLEGILNVAPDDAGVRWVDTLTLGFSDAPRAPEATLGWFVARDRLAG